MLLRPPVLFNLEDSKDVRELGVSFGYKLLSGENTTEERRLIVKFFKMKWNLFWKKSTLFKAIIFWKKGG